MQGNIKRSVVKKIAQRLAHHNLVRPHSSKKPSASATTRPQPKLSIGRSRERLRARLALWMIVAFIVICVALVIAALVKATNSSELLEIIGRLLPYLMALLTPILHYYFEHRQRHADDDKEV